MMPNTSLDLTYCTIEPKTHFNAYCHNELCYP